MADTAYQAGKSAGINDKTIEKIREKAESNTPLQSATPEKQAIYDAYQQQYVGKITQKALAGETLSAPNAYKNEIYNKALQQQQPQQSQGPVSIDDYIRQAQGNSQAQFEAMRQFLQGSADGQLQQQTAQLGQARDQQLAEIQKALNNAVAQGQISVREAERQFEQQSATIAQQAYNDSEITALSAQDRGIQNSAQFIGLQQGDQARNRSLVSQNLTQRDQTINDINQQLTQLKYDADINTGLANSQYNYGLAGAQGQINQNLNNQLAGLSQAEYERLANQGFDLTKLGIQNQYDTERLNQQQIYQLQQQAVNQNYTQQNLQTEQNFSLEKLSAQQRYTLEQLATSQGYDLQKLSVQQQNDLAKLAQAYGYDLGLQNNSQQFQASQNAADRGLQVQLQNLRQSHDFALLDAQQQAEFEKYEVELGRKYAQYQPGTTENALLNAEYDFALNSLQKESAAQLASDLGAKKLATLLESYPKELPDLNNKKAVDDYNAKVEALNAQVQAAISGDGFKYTQDKLKANTKIKEEEKSGFLNFLKGGLKIIGNYGSNILP